MDTITESLTGRQGLGIEARVAADGTAELAWVADSRDIAELSEMDAQDELDWALYLRDGMVP